MSGQQFIVERLRRHEDIPMVRKVRGFHHLIIMSEWKVIHDSMTTAPLASQRRTWRADMLSANDLRAALDGVTFAHADSRAKVADLHRLLHHMEAHVSALAAALADVAPARAGWATTVPATVYGVLLEALRICRADGAGGSCFHLANAAFDLCGAMRRIARPAFDAGPPFPLNATRMAPLVIRLVALCLDVLRVKLRRGYYPPAMFVDFAQTVFAREEAVVEYEDEPGRAQREEAARP